MMDCIFFYKKCVSSVLLIVSVPLMMIGCGQKGDLYLANSKQKDSFLLPSSDTTDNVDDKETGKQKYQKLLNNPNDF